MDTGFPGDSLKKSIAQRGARKRRKTQSIRQPFGNGFGNDLSAMPKRDSAPLFRRARFDLPHAVHTEHVEREVDPAASASVLDAESAPCEFVETLHLFDRV